MPQYSIYILDADEISITGGKELSGETQGDGRHLQDETITLLSANWREIRISDNDDEFEDNGGSSQVLEPGQTVNGTFYSGSPRVEAEYSLTVSFGGEQWTVIGFNVNNSDPAYGTVEALAFIGPQGGFPPVGEPLFVEDWQEGPRFDAAEYATPICFAAGTRIAVPGGWRQIELLQPGERVLTRDDGAQMIRLLHMRRSPGIGVSAPVVFEPGALGNTARLIVSPQHRMLVTGWQAELMFGASEVLVPALHMVGLPGIYRRYGQPVTYLHLVLERHQVLQAEGSWAESFLPGPQGLATLTHDERAGVLEAFPTAQRGLDAARPCLGQSEARALMAEAQARPMQ